MMIVFPTRETITCCDRPCGRRSASVALGSPLELVPHPGSAAPSWLTLSAFAGVERVGIAVAARRA